jgi:hypothetical protein
MMYVRSVHRKKEWKIDNFEKTCSQEGMDMFERKDSRPCTAQVPRKME